jgi:hypothetical protein
MIVVLVAMVWPKPNDGGKGLFFTALGQRHWHTQGVAIDLRQFFDVLDDDSNVPTLAFQLRDYCLPTDHGSREGPECKPDDRDENTAANGVRMLLQAPSLKLMAKGAAVKDTTNKEGGSAGGATREAGLRRLAGVRDRDSRASPERCSASTCQLNAGSPPCPSTDPG